ncbi:STAS domain-containing protein [Streptomyces roseolus]|uniref:STAS domain-containing protein n=1 Tax=Streptomyces roseolus TaxID=67358 RepID=UPI00167238F0|nr:STAS domain-containing protein [Streptomyces roseolus]GGR18206.1 anti-sigma factor antagonist [Streptomyces roseolus]
MFSVEVEEEGRGTVLVLRGELDHDSAVQLDEAGRRSAGAADGAARPVVADLAALTFCDSSGISALLRLHRHLSARGRPLGLAAVPRTVRRLFALTGLDQIFTAHSDVHEAFAAGPVRPDTAPGAGAPARQNRKESA